MFDFHRRIALVVCAVLLLSAVPVKADNSKSLPTPAIVVVDVQRILDESMAAKSVQKQLESQRSHFQTQIEQEENGLRSAEDDLNKARDQLTADVYSEREQQLRQRFLTVERHVQARRKVLDQAFGDSMNTVRSSLLDIVNTVAHEKGANIVLIKQQVLWTDKGLDVTDEVLDRLNAKLSKVTVKMAPEEAEEKENPPK
jgi:outer membrane protein